MQRPAVRNLSREQFGRAIALGERVARGDVGLGELDERSLGLRGKRKGRGKGAGVSG